MVGMKEYNPDIKESKASFQKMPKTQDELPVRTMKESFDSAAIPLSSNQALRERYTSILGQVRLGRLMEDLDLFAGLNIKKILQSTIGCYNSLTFGYNESTL